MAIQLASLINLPNTLHDVSLLSLPDSEKSTNTVNLINTLRTTLRQLNYEFSPMPSTIPLMVSLNMLLPTALRFIEDQSGCAIEFTSALWDALPINMNLTSSIKELSQCDICLSSNTRVPDQHTQFLRVPAPLTHTRTLDQLILDMLQEKLRPNPPTCNNISCPAHGSELQSSLHFTPKHSLSIIIERLAITHPMTKRVTTPIIGPKESSTLYGGLQLTGVTAYDTTPSSDGSDKKHWIFYKRTPSPSGFTWFKLDSQIGYPIRASPFNDQSDRTTLDIFTFTEPAL